MDQQEQGAVDTLYSVESTMVCKYKLESNAMVMKQVKTAKDILLIVVIFCR